MKKIMPITRIALPTLFFGALISLLFLQNEPTSTTAMTIVTQEPTLSVQQTPEPKDPLPSCNTNSDCPLPTTYCADHKCIELINPVCTCSQSQILRCTEQSGRARYLYCPNSCATTDTGTVCQ